MAYFGNEDGLDVLKRRYIFKNNNDFLIDPVPDIFFTDTKETLNYKGITIIQNGVLDLSTREAKSI